MRRIIGFALLALGCAAGAVLLALGRLGSERVADSASGVTPVGGWHVTVVQFDPNWWAVVPLAACIVVGLLCVALPARR
jgi:hypothetical protein